MVDHALRSDPIPVDLPGRPMMTRDLAKVLAELARRVAEQTEEGEAA